jgi:anaerobic selenocysteine-containing dehydrogenase
MTQSSALRATLDSGIERARTTCTFCRMGCELEVIRQGWRIAGVEYPADAAVNQGRLCPRGSASAMLLDHPMRLAYPLKDGKESSWSEFLAEVGARLRTTPSNELAIAYDRNLTREELELVYGLANRLGTENVASAYLESEACFDLRLDAKAKATTPVTLQDVIQADTILIVGDAFAKMPVLAKPVLDARYQSRDRRLYCIDCVKTTTAGFAHRFIRTEPGFEPLVLLALAGLVGPKLAGFDCEQVAAKCGANPDDLREIAEHFGKAKKGIVIGAITSGRTMDPKLFSMALQLLVNRMKGNKKLLIAAEAAVPPGPCRLSEILAAVEGGEVKTLLNFGDVFPWDYAGLAERLRKLDLLVTTATMRPAGTVPGWVLPVAMNLEKAGSVTTAWGHAALNPALAPASGTRLVSDIIFGLLGDTVAGEAIPESPAWLKGPVKSVTDQGRAMLKRRENEVDPEFRFVLLAEHPAYDFRGVFSQAIHPLLLTRGDAGQLGVEHGDRVKLETKAGVKLELNAAISDRITDGALLVNSGWPATRALFAHEVDKLTGIVTIPPVKVKLWRSE